MTLSRYVKQHRHPFDFPDYLVEKPIDITADGTLSEKGLHQAYHLLYRYRSKKVETFRHIIVDASGTIRDQIAITNKSLVSASFSAENKDANAKQNHYWNAIKSYLKEHNYSLLIAHNHPTGQIVPSTRDETLTAQIELELSSLGGTSRFLGHIILDHGNFAFYKPGKGWQYSADPETRKIHDPLMHPKKNNSIIPFMISGDDTHKMMWILNDIDGKSHWKTEGKTPFFALDQRYVIAGIYFFNNRDIIAAAQSPEQWNRFFIDFHKKAALLGADSFFPVNRSDDEKLEKALLFMAEKKIFLDGYNQNYCFSDKDPDLASHYIDPLYSPTVIASSKRFKEFTRQKKLKQVSTYIER